MDPLFKALQVGPFLLKHRVALPPLTRMRAGKGEVPTLLNAEYYSQRATDGGLIIAEATQVTPGGQGLVGTPGIFTKAQAEGWKGVVNAIHKKKGIVFLQLWHVGRSSHSSFQTEEDFPDVPKELRKAVSSYPIALSGKGPTREGIPVPFEVPRALETHEIPRIVQFYKRGAELAKEAGFDGIEIHAANGYLLQQFLADNVNKRTDKYGGSIENRSRIVFEVLDAVTQVFPSNQVAIRFSPWGNFQDIDESDPLPQYSYILKKIEALNLAYVHLIEPRISGGIDAKSISKFTGKSVATTLRPFYKGVIVVAGFGSDIEGGRELVADGSADIVAFGRIFIANPDLPARIRSGRPLNEYNRATFYTPGEKGYTDYSFDQQSSL